MSSVNISVRPHFYILLGWHVICESFLRLLFGSVKGIQPQSFVVDETRALLVIVSTRLATKPMWDWEWFHRFFLLWHQDQFPFNGLCIFFCIISDLHPLLDEYDWVADGPCFVRLLIWFFCPNTGCNFFPAPLFLVRISEMNSIFFHYYYPSLFLFLWWLFKIFFCILISCVFVICVTEIMAIPFFPFSLCMFLSVCSFELFFSFLFLLF